MATYIVEILVDVGLPFGGEHQFEYVNADNVQMAVDFVKQGLNDSEKIVEVSKVCKGWKA